MLVSLLSDSMGSDFNSTKKKTKCKKRRKEVEKKYSSIVSSNNEKIAENSLMDNKIYPSK
jgi:hypothetical protein